MDNMKSQLDYSAVARIIALYLDRFCDRSLPYPEMVAEAARKADAELQRLRAIEERYNKLRGLLADPLIIANADNPGKLRPVKGTSKESIYRTILKAQKIIGITNRWFPWERRPWDERHEEDSDKEKLEADKKTEQGIPNLTEAQKKEEKLIILEGGKAYHFSYGTLLMVTL